MGGTSRLSPRFPHVSHVSTFCPHVFGIGGRRPQRCRNGRNRSRPRQKNRGVLPGTRRSAPTCVPEQGSVEARIPRSCFCLLNGTPRRIFLPGSCPPSQNVWFPIRPSRRRQPRSLAPSPNGEKGHASAPFRRHGGGHATRDSPRSRN